MRELESTGDIAKLLAELKKLIPTIKLDEKGRGIGQFLDRGELSNEEWVRANDLLKAVRGMVERGEKIPDEFLATPQEVTDFEEKNNDDLLQI